MKKPIKRVRLSWTFIKVFVAVLCIQLVLHLGLTPKPSYSEQEKAQGVWENTMHTALSDSSCQRIHICTVSTTIDMAREAIFMFRSALHFRPRGLFQLHLGVTNHTQMIWTTLLDTWQLKQVSVSFYNTKSDKLAEMVDILLEASLAGDHVEKVILIGPKMRVFKDIENLWQHFNDFQTQVLGIIPWKKENVTLEKLAVTLEELADKEILLLDVAKARVRQASLAVLHKDDLFPVPCTWGVPSNSPSPPEHISAIIISPDTLTSYVKNKIVRDKLELLAAMERKDGLIFSLHDDVCAVNSSQKLIAGMKNIGSIDPICQEFADFSALPKRTHLYFAGHLPVSSSRFSVSLLTQLSLDRWSFLERTLERWSGPVHAILYLTDAEAQQLLYMYQHSELRGRTNVALHVVYKRKGFYNKNHLRNMLLDVATTPYVFILDVDFIPSINLEDKLKQHIESSLDGKPKRALVVPALELLDSNLPTPGTKNEVLAQYKKTITLFHQKSFPYGHNPTNFPVWMKTKETYKITYSAGFEPYVVLQKENAPRYYELLLDRMQDKIAYSLQLFALGYEFMVVPEVFIIHLPHPKSTGFHLWNSYKNYARCHRIIITDYVQQLKRYYPAVNIPHLYGML